MWVCARFVAVEIIAHLVAERDDAEQLLAARADCPACRDRDPRSCGAARPDRRRRRCRCPSRAPGGRGSGSTGPAASAISLPAHVGDLIDLLAEFGRCWRRARPAPRRSVSTVCSSSALLLVVERHQARRLGGRDRLHRRGRGQHQIGLGRGGRRGRGGRQGHVSGRKGFLLGPARSGPAGSSAPESSLTRSSLAGSSTPRSSATGSSGVGSSVPGSSPPASGTPLSTVGSPAHLEVSTVATGLDVPWGLDFLPDGTALVTERDTAALKSIAPGGAVSDIGTVAGVGPGGEGGLMGLAVSPDFARTHGLRPLHLLGRQPDRRPDHHRRRHCRPAGGAGRAAPQLDPQRRPDRVRSGRLPLRRHRRRPEPATRTGPAYLGGKILRIDTDGNGADGNPFRSRRWSTTVTATSRVWPSTTRDGSGPASSVRTPGTS